MKKFLIIFLLTVSISYAQNNFKFAWLSDIHVDTQTAQEDLQRSVDDINSMSNVSFIIVSGDISSNGTLKELIIAKEILDKLEKPYYIIPGNHDLKWSESGGTDFIKLWGADHFTFEFGKYLFIAMHQGPRMRMAYGHWAPEDLRWFDSVIDTLSDPEQPIIFITHYPINDEIDNWYEMLERLKKINTQAALFGHGHINKTFNFEGLPGIMGRSNLRNKEKIGGYNLVEIKNDSIFFYERIPTQSTSLWYQLKLHKINYQELKVDQPRPDYSINEKYLFVKIIWEFDSGYTISSSAAVKDNSVFLGDASGYFYALSINDGSIKWKFKSKDAIYSTPAVKDDYVVFGSADSSIYCLDIKDGKLIWQYKTNAAVLGCPVVVNNIVYIGGSDRVFRAINLQSGNLVWEFNGLNGFVETKPVFYDNKIMFGAWDSYFYCLDALTGKLNWKWKGESSRVLFSPAACWAVASDDLVFFAAPDRKLTALNIKTGKEAWRTGKYQVRETVGLSEDGKILFARTMDDTIFALPVADKLSEPLWITNCGFGYEISAAQIVEKDGVIFYATKNGMVYSLNSKTGKILWQYKITNGYVNTITPVSNNKIITTDFDGKVKLIQSK